MPEDLRRMDDEAAVPLLDPEAPPLVAAPGRQLGSRREMGDPRLNQAAATVGSAVGTAVHTVRNAPEEVRRRFEVIRGRGREAGGSWRQSAQEKLSEARHTAEQKIAETREAASTRAAEVREAAEERAAEWRQVADRRMRDARHRAARFVDEQPLRAILAVAGSAFLVGVLLRMWRSRNAY